MPVELEAWWKEFDIKLSLEIIPLIPVCKSYNSYYHVKYAKGKYSTQFIYEISWSDLIGSPRHFENSINLQFDAFCIYHNIIWWIFLIIFWSCLTSKASASTSATLSSSPLPASDSDCSEWFVFSMLLTCSAPSNPIEFSDRFYRMERGGMIIIVKQWLMAGKWHFYSGASLVTSLFMACLRSSLSDLQAFLVASFYCMMSAREEVTPNIGKLDQPWSRLAQKSHFNPHGTGGVAA